MFFSMAIMVVSMIAQWKIFEKMGREGWISVIPLYNIYIMFEELYGNGWRFLLLLIPLYNIYILFRLYMDMAQAFNKPTSFGVGLLLVNVVFMCILAFTDAKYTKPAIAA